MKRKQKAKSNETQPPFGTLSVFEANKMISYGKKTIKKKITNGQGYFR
jgi:hypothetical protein